MTDTVAVAFIAVFGTLGSGALSYFAARRNTQVQLASIEVELKRLDAARIAEARSERSELYHAFLSAAFDLEELARGLRGSVTKEAYLDTITAFGRTYTNVILLGDEQVTPFAAELKAAASSFTEAHEEVLREDESMELLDALRPAFSRVSGDWVGARNKFVAAIRKDIKLDVRPS